MKIAIMGAGALGCFIGGLLHNSGADVTFVARGATLAALKNGLTINSPVVPNTLTDLKVAASPAECGPVDAIIFLVKLYDVNEAAAAMLPMVGPKTTIFAFQNGIDGPEMIEKITGKGTVVPGIAYLPASIPEPGTVNHNGVIKGLVFGERDGAASQRCKDFAKICENAELDITLTDKIETDLWEKMVIHSAFCAITATTRLPIGPVLADPFCKEMFEAATFEAQAVAEAVIPYFPKDCAQNKLDFASKLAPDMKASLATDLDNGKRIELDYMGGTIVRLGKKHGIPTPVQSFAYATLHPFINGTPASSTS